MSQKSLIDNYSRDRVKMNRVSPGVVPLTKKPEDSGYEIVQKVKLRVWWTPINGKILHGFRTVLPKRSSKTFQQPNSKSVTVLKGTFPSTYSVIKNCRCVQRGLYDCDPPIIHHALITESQFITCSEIEKFYLKKYDFFKQQLFFLFNLA